MSAAEESRRTAIIADLGPTSDDDLTEVYNGPIISIRRIRETVSRQRLLLLVAAALGLCIGLAFHLVVPTKATAVSEIYLTEPASAGQGGVGDDISLMETNTVATKALGQLPAWVDASSVGGYNVLAVSNSIVQLDAHAANARLAVAWAAALEKAFFAVRNTQLEAQTSVLVSTLDAQRSQLRSDVRRLNTEIYALEVPSASARVADRIGLLVSERGNDENQIGQITSQVQQDQLDHMVVLRGSSVIDPPVASAVSKKKVFAMDGLTGLVGGGALGLGLAIVGALVSDRPRRRSDIADLLWTPVEMSLGRPRGGILPGPLRRVGRYRRLRRSGPARVALRRIVGHLEGAGGRLALVPVGKRAVGEGATWLVSVASGLARSDVRVLLVDLTATRSLGRLLGVRQRSEQPRSVRRDGGSFDVLVLGDDPGDHLTGNLEQGYDAVLVLAALEPSLGAEHLTAWASAAVILVSAGQASETRLVSTGQMLREAHVRARSAIVMGALRGDESFGAADNAAEYTGPGRPLDTGGRTDGERVALVEGHRNIPPPPPRAHVQG